MCFQGRVKASRHRLSTTSAAPALEFKSKEQPGRWSVWADLRCFLPVLEGSSGGSRAAPQGSSMERALQARVSLPVPVVPRGSSWRAPCCEGMRHSFISAPRPEESRRPQGGSVVVPLTNSELYAGPGLQPSHSPRERGTPLTGGDTELRWPATHTGCRSPEVSPLLLLAFTKSEKSMTPNYVAHVFVSFSSHTRSLITSVAKF